MGLITEESKLQDLTKEAIINDPVIKSLESRIDQTVFSCKDKELELTDNGVSVTIKDQLSIGMIKEADRLIKERKAAIREEVKRKLKE